jgi:YD repeat-containing protein
MAVIQPRPARNPSIVGAGVYSHSGAFTSAAQDLRIPGRDIDLGVLRTYYSGGIDVRYSFGPGWASTYAQSVRREGKDIVYQDGVGAEYRFVRSKHGFRTPHGLYGSLHISKTGVELHWPYGVVFRFDALHAGGRLTGIANANGNRIQLTHNATQTELIDTLGNHVVVSFQNDLITQIVDHIGRTWTYVYDANRCLTQVVRPALAGSPTGTTLRYSYDASLRLTTITNPNSVTVLRNYYAASGRVVQQDHGTGTFKFQYSLAGGVHRTQVTQKNGATLVIAHDHAGHARERVLYVSASAFSPEDRVHVKNGRVPVRTVAKFNVHGELVESVGPDGDRTIQKYAERDPDPRARGNLLRRERRPSPKLPADQKQLTWSFRYERRFQRCREQTDPRGHTTSFQYDRRGNLVKTRFPAVRVPDLRGPQRARYRVSHLVERQIVRRVLRVRRSAQSGLCNLQLDDGDAAVRLLVPYAVRDGRRGRRRDLLRRHGEPHDARLSERRSRAQVL